MLFTLRCQIDNTSASQCGATKKEDKGAHYPGFFLFEPKWLEKRKENSWKFIEGKNYLFTFYSFLLTRSLAMFN